MNNNSHTICVNTAQINKHLDAIDKQDEAEQFVYDKVVYSFRDELEEVECQEDIHDDLNFEVQYIIDRDSWDVEAEAVINRIFTDFDIKGAE